MERSATDARVRLTDRRGLFSVAPSRVCGTTIATRRRGSGTAFRKSATRSLGTTFRTRSPPRSPALSRGQILLPRLVQYFQHRARIYIPVELGYRCANGFAIPFRGQGTPQPLGESARIRRWHQKSVGTVAHEFWHAANPRGYDG